MKKWLLLLAVATISCEKEGYRQARVFRFPLPKGKPIKSIETECRLQKS